MSTLHRIDVIVRESAVDLADQRLSGMTPQGSVHVGRGPVSILELPLGMLADQVGELLRGPKP